MKKNKSLQEQIIATIYNDMITYVMSVGKNIQKALNNGFNVKFIRNGQKKPVAFKVFLIFFVDLSFMSFMSTKKTVISIFRIAILNLLNLRKTL